LDEIDIGPHPGSVFDHFGNDYGSTIPLYYAALCGFTNVVEQLIVKHPQHVNATGGHYKTPAVAALAGRHFELAQLLHRNKSSLESRGCCEIAPLHTAAYHGDLEMVQVLLECGVDVNAKNAYGHTPLDFALSRVQPNEVALLSIAQGADPNTRNMKGFTPLHRAAENGWIEIVRLLIEHGANIEVKDKERNGAEVASGKQLNETIKSLLEHLSK
jgi:ankyrin repeat protein